jgi:hypothetical protein
MTHLKRNRKHGNGKSTRTNRAAEKPPEQIPLILQSDHSEIVPTTDNIGSYGLLEIAEQLGKIHNSLRRQRECLRWRNVFSHWPVLSAQLTSGAPCV